jgi:hypothetical protein
MGTKTHTDAAREADDRDPGSRATRVFADPVEADFRRRVTLGTKTATEAARENVDNDPGRERAYFPR